MAYTLDTAAAAERIASAGVSPEVARADDGRRDDLATKADLFALEVRLVKWGVGIALGTAGILFAVLRLTG